LGTTAGIAITDGLKRIGIGVLLLFEKTNCRECGDGLRERGGDGHQGLTRSTLKQQKRDRCLRDAEQSVGTG